MLPAGLLLCVCTPLDTCQSQKMAFVAASTLWSCSGLLAWWDYAQPFVIFLLFEKKKSSSTYFSSPHLLRMKWDITLLHHTFLLSVNVQTEARTLRGRQSLLSFPAINGASCSLILVLNGVSCVIISPHNHLQLIISSRSAVPPFYNKENVAILPFFRMLRLMS